MACSVAVLALASTAATTAGAQPVSVDQGDAIVVNGSACTVGFNEGASSYTAAHCGRSGDRVRLLLDDGTLTPEAGTLQDSPANAGTTNDWARIDWDEGVDVGPNEYSGDGAVGLADVHHGDRVCTYGWATSATTCGTFHTQVGNSFLVDIPGGLDGDSGGPLWVPGLGFLGVHSATVSGRDNTTGVTKTFLLGATTSDGGDISEAVTNAFLDYFTDPEAWSGATATGTTSPDPLQLERDHTDRGDEGLVGAQSFGLARPEVANTPGDTIAPSGADQSAPVAEPPAASVIDGATAEDETSADDISVTTTKPGRSKGSAESWLCLVLDGLLVLFSSILSLIFDR